MRSVGSTVGGDSPGGPRPLFICGTARSGTTLVTSLLDAHPELAVFPGETYFYRLLIDRFPSRLATWAAEFFELQGLKAILGRYPLTRISFQGRRALEERLTQWSQSFAGDASVVPVDVVREVVRNNRWRREYWKCFLEIYDRLAAEPSRTKKYWVEKTPSNERFVVLYEQSFHHAARYLHILRDPRDVIASWILRTNVVGPERAKTIYHVSYVWSFSVHACLTNARMCPGRYGVLRYESLVQETQDVMNGVAGFLGIEPHPGLLTPTHLGTAVAINSSYGDLVPVTGTVVASQIGRYREVLEEREVAFVERILSEQLHACGYPLNGTMDRSQVSQTEHLAQRDIVSRIKLRRIVSLQRNVGDIASHVVGGSRW